MIDLSNIGKIIKNFKPVEIRNEIKNPSIIKGGVRYKSPNVNINFSEINVDNKQLTVLAEKLSDKVIERIGVQVVGEIATDLHLQEELISLDQQELTKYLRTTVSGTATIAQLQPDFLESGGMVFPDLQEIFKKGYEVGSKGRGQVDNVKIYKTEKNGLVIQYDEA